MNISIRTVAWSRQTRVSLLIAPVFAFLMQVSGLAGTNASATRKSNIVILLADQWRAQAFGYAGDPNAKTPNLDRLEQQSIRFSNAVSSVPVCCPARASLLTGQRVLTHGVFTLYPVGWTEPTTGM